MEKSLQMYRVILLTGIVAGSAFARELNPMIERLASKFDVEFEAALPPKEESQIQVGKQWVCSRIDIPTNEIHKSEDLQSFRFEDGVNDKAKVNVGSDPTKVFYFEPGNLLAGTTENEVTTIRVKTNGDLIVKKATRVDKKVVGYLLCRHSILDSAPAEEPKNTSEQQEDCGLSGNVDARIADCLKAGVQPKVSTKGDTWKLVTRTGQKEVWKDMAGLIWGDKLEDRYAWNDKDDPKRSLMKKVNGKWQETGVCQSDESLEARGDITTLSWFIPSADDYDLAKKHGIHKILPNMADWFWTSSPGVFGRQYFDGIRGYLGLDVGHGHFAVRCVAL